MSRFTGKSDFCDFFEEAVHKEDFYNSPSTHIYIGNSEVKVTNEKDLYQYFPFIIGSMSAHKLNDGHISYTIFLTKEPYWDLRETEALSWYVWEFLRSHKKWMSFKKKFQDNTSLEDFQEFQYELNSSYDRKVFNTISERLINVENLKDYYFLVKNKIDVKMKDKILQDFVEEKLSNIHLNFYQKQRETFLKWWDENCDKDKNYSRIIENIRFQLHPLC